MSDDLKERLRDPHRRLVRSDREEAAAHIEVLEAALKPFADAYDRFDAAPQFERYSFSRDELRPAKLALSHPQKQGGA